MTPSISPRDPTEELNKHEKIARILGFLAMIVLTLGVVFLAWDYLRSPEKAEAHVDDTAICKDALMWFLKEPSVSDYCVGLMERGL